MFELTNEIRSYAWGSHTAIAEFLGRLSASAEPEAELWIGAYPGFASRLPDGKTLAQFIAEDPEAALGAAAVARFGPRLPFLMKVLAIGSPLSLQAHPNAAQAVAGFAAEEAAGVPLDDPTRNYRDARHKPEMLCALTPVEALCGFRAVEDTVAMLGELAVPELEGLREALVESGLQRGVRWILDLADDDIPVVVPALARALPSVDIGTYSSALHWLSRLADQYRRDRGVILALLCDFVRLEPGEALVIPAGMLHAYLSGVGVELMAESDNVLRGGLTAKHVDVADLQRILDLHSAVPEVLRGEKEGLGRTRFPAGIDEFELCRVEVADAVALEGNRPTLVLTVEGSARLRATDGTVLDLPRGHAAFLSAAEKDVEISGPAVVFEATTAPG